MADPALHPESTTRKPPLTAEWLRRGRPKHNKSGYRGVCYHKKSAKWRAYIVVNGRQRALGRFKTAHEAHHAYVAACREAVGEFALD